MARLARFGFFSIRVYSRPFAVKISRPSRSMQLRRAGSSVTQARATSAELVAHRLDARNVIHQVAVPWLETLHERPLLATHQNGEDVALMPG